MKTVVICLTILGVAWMLFRAELVININVTHRIDLGNLVRKVQVP